MPSNAGFQPFKVGVEHEGRTVVVRFSGEFDLAGVNAARAAIWEAFDSQPAAVALDLRDLDYMDSTGLGCLLDATEQARRVSVPLGVLNGVGPAHRVLELTGACDALRMIDDLSELSPDIESERPADEDLRV